MVWGVPFGAQLSTIVLLFLVHTRVAAAMFESFVYGTAWGAWLLCSSPSDVLLFPSSSLQVP